MELKIMKTSKYGDLCPIDNNNNSINPFHNEPLFQNQEFNQYKNRFMQVESINQYYSFNQDIAPGREYRIGDGASNLVGKEAKGKNDLSMLDMLDSQDCNNDKAINLVKEKRSKNTAFPSYVSSSIIINKLCLLLFL